MMADVENVKGGDGVVRGPINPGDPSLPSAIEVVNIVKKFGDFTAVNDVSFSVKEGEVFGLLGPNGAGKSTLIRMLTTLVPITSGIARIGGHDVAKEPTAARRDIGVIPQAMTSDLDLTVVENMRIYSKLYNVPVAERERQIEKLLGVVDLTKWRNSATKTLSGGMRRRLEIARGLVHSPKMFFLDEPTTGLDPVSRVAVWEMLTKIKQERNLTVLVTTHYMDEADRLCDRIAIVDHGTLVALDTPEALKASIPGSNVIEAQFTGAAADWEAQLKRLPGVESVQPEGNAMYRLLSNEGAKTTTALVEHAIGQKVEIKSLHVQSTTLDDVFVYYTGRQLRDATHAAATYIPAGQW
jgi:ABC-2 type transport system ATP-binding protein